MHSLRVLLTVLCEHHVITLSVNSTSLVTLLCAHHVIGNPALCTPGNYIMYPMATDGTHRNNLLFSDCARMSMGAVLKAKRPGM